MKVNIIPLIAKADTLTPEECQQFKKQVSKMTSWEFLDSNIIHVICSFHIFIIMCYSVVPPATLLCMCGCLHYIKNNC